MGELLKADLSFGVALDDEQLETLPWKYEEGDEEDERPSFKDWLQQLGGIASPVPPEFDELPYLQGKEKIDEWLTVPANREVLNDYHAAARLLEDECPIDIVSVYSYEEDGSSACIIAVKSSVQTAHWQGGPDPRTVTFDVAEDDLVAANAFCEMHGLPFGEPKWLLSVMR